MKALAILTKALENFGPKGEHWTRGAWFRKDKKVIPAGPGYAQDFANAFDENSDGMKVCSLGGLEMATAQLKLQVYGQEYAEAETALDHAANKMPKRRLTFAFGESVISYNDNSKKFADVKKMFQKAICNLKKEVL